MLNFQLDKENASKYMTNMHTIKHTNKKGYIGYSHLSKQQLINFFAPPAMEKQTDKYTFFYSGSILSNQFPSNFIVDDINFNCVEQYMMYMKAISFNDIKTSELILNESSPQKQKKLGRRAKNFNQKEWDKIKENIVKKGAIEKFYQNPSLKKMLFNTKNNLLAEASPYDKIWGIGLGINNKNIVDPNKWKGQNLLGKILTSIKETI